MRIRTIKPEFWQNEELANVSAEACLLAIALLNYADDEGCFNAHPKLVSASCCPLREMDVVACLRELEEIGYIETIVVSGRSIGRIVTFTRHQHIARPSRSTLAHHFNEDSMNAHGGLIEDSMNAHGGLIAGKERKGKEGKKQPKVVLGGNAARARTRRTAPDRETQCARTPPVAAETTFGRLDVDIETEQARREQVARMRGGSQ
jgi:hypothetical protein